jgi:hypothetical protein
MSASHRLWGSVMSLDRSFGKIGLGEIKLQKRLWHMYMQSSYECDNLKCLSMTLSDNVSKN